MTLGLRPASLSLSLAVALAAGCGDTPSGLVDPEDCAQGSVLELAPGDAVSGVVGGGTALCLSSGTAAEYALVPFVGEDRDTLLRAEVVIESTRFLPDSTTFVAGRSLLDVVAAPVGGPGVGTGTGGELLAILSATDALHGVLRSRERRLMATHVDGGSIRRPSFRAPTRGAAPPTEGSTLELSVSAICESPDARTGRVVAVTEHAIVVADQTNPEGGFTDEQLRGFGEEFDELVHPTIVAVFGEPSDLDGNGRVILFFTSGVNQKSPAGGAGVVAGYFWAGDLFPRDPSGPLEACPSSNEGEVLYLAVPDPAGAIGGRAVRLDALLQITTTTVGHELQHLLNAGRRIHVNGATRGEETWLNEGLSLIAEELLFYAATGLEPGLNLDAAALTAEPALTAAFNRFQEPNVGRFNLHIQVARTSSPMARDRLETRGATWAFLRYAADRDPGPDDELFRRLGNAASSGLTNLSEALDADPLEWMSEWGVAVLTDDLLPANEARFDQPSWNMRSLIPALRPLDRRFPIQLLGLHGPGAYLVRLEPSGATAYPVFRLPAGRSDVLVRPNEGYGGATRFALVRID